MRRDGAAKLDRAEAELLIDLMSGLLGNPGLDKLSELPTINDLIPDLLPDLTQSIKELTAGE